MPQSNEYIQKRTILPRQVIVSTSGAGDFQSVKDAVDWVATQGPSQSNPFLIRLGPGLYTEAPFSVPAFVKIEGAGWLASILVASDPSEHFITLGPATVLRALNILGPTGVGKAAIRHAPNDVRAASIIEVTISRGYYGVLSDPSTIRSPLLIQNLVNAYAGSVTAEFLRGEGYADITASSCIAAAPDGKIGKGFSVVGPNAKLLGVSCLFECGGGDALFVDNSAYARLQSCVLVKGENAIHVGPNGNPLVCITGTAIRNHGTETFTKDIFIETASAGVLFDGTLSRSKVDNAVGALLVLSATDIDAGGYGKVVLGEMRVGTDLAKLTPFTDYAKKAYLTGIASGGSVTRATGLQLNVTAGTGFINDGNDPIPVSWSGTTVTLDANKEQYVYVSADGLVHLSDAAPDYNTNIVLARARTGASDVLVLSRDDIPIRHLNSRLSEFLEHSVGPLIITGGLVTKNPTAYKLDVSDGKFWHALSERVINAGTEITFKYWYHDGSGAWVCSDTNVIDPDYYDNGAGKVALTTDYWKKDVLYAVANDGGTEFHVIYANNEYATRNAAANAALPAPPPILHLYGIPLGGILVQQSHTGTDIDTVYDVRPRLDSAVSIAGVTGNHSALTNLANDDHLQYLTTDRATTWHGTLPGAHVTNGNSHAHIGGAGAQIDHDNLANKGTVSHASLDAHVGSTSNPHSVTAAQVGAPPITRSINAGNGLSGGGDLSADRSLAVQAANGSISVDSSGVSVGVINDTQHGTRGGGALHADATASTAGFLSASDKAKLDRRQTARNTAVVTNNTTSFVSVPDLTFNLVSGRTYRFQFNAIFQSTVAGTGIKFGVQGTAGYSALALQTHIPTSLTAITHGSARAYDSGSPSASVDAINSNILAVVEGMIVCNADGTFSLRFGSEVAGNTVSVRPGSIGILEEVA